MSATPEGSYPKAVDDPLYASEASLLASIFQVYTGGGFNSTATNTTQESSTEMTAIPAADLTGAKYVIIEVLATITDSSNGTTTATSQFKIQEKYTGNSYADEFAYLDAGYCQSGSGVASANEQLQTIRWVHTLTANDKANGCQFKIYSKSIAGAGSLATFASPQTVVYIVGGY